MGIRRHKPPPTDPFDDGRLDDLEQPTHVTLIWNDETSEWDLTSNCEAQVEVVSALSHTLWLFAVGDLAYDSD